MSYGPVLSKTVEDRHWWFASRTRALLALLDPAVAESVARAGNGGAVEPATTLDVGCGAGNMIHHLGRYGAVIGVDNFARPLAVARERGYMVADAGADALPLEDASFRLVALLDVLEHCPDDRRVLSECRRVLRPGGVLALTVPAFQWLWSDNDVINGHRRRYTPGGLRALLTDAGFRVHRITCNNLAILPMAVALNVARSLRGRKLGIAAPATDDDAYQVEMQPTNPMVNGLLDAVGRVEAGIVRSVSLPLGTGIIAVASS